jgi:protein-S-isoprenylcysteine O-methyltransferase Ste14
MRSVYSRSVPQKALILSLQTLFLAGTFLLLLTPTIHHGPLGPRVVLLGFGSIVCLRYWFAMLALIKRELSYSEAGGIVMAFAVYFLGYGYLSLGRRGGIDWVDILAIVIFLFGCFLSTGSELQRDIWKKDPQNRGKLYTKGLFRFSMHVNYFGEELWVLAYAVVTRNPFSYIIPALVFALFAFTQIPDLDGHLARKYGTEFQEYKSKTKRFIPFVY